MIEIGDKVRILGHPQGLFYGQEVRVRQIKRRVRKTVYQCDVTFEGTLRPSWFTASEVQKVQPTKEMQS